MYKKIENGIAKHIHKNVPFDFGKLMGVWLLFLYICLLHHQYFIFYFYYFQSLVYDNWISIYVCSNNRRDEEAKLRWRWWRRRNVKVICWKMLVHFGFVELNKNLGFLRCFIATRHAFNSFDFCSECICLFIYFYRAL